MFKLATYSINENVILSPKHRIMTWIKHEGKHSDWHERMDLYVQRVESSLYNRMGWDSMHYLDQQGTKFNPSHPSLMFTDSKDRCIAYVAYHNHTHRGCKNGIMISRIVVAPQFRGRGLSVVILNLVGAMLTASGYVLYFITELDGYGNKVGESGCWKGTTFDDRFRNTPSDARNKHRRGGKASHKKYVGKALVCYSDLFLKVAVLRSRVAKKEAVSTVPHTGADVPFLMFDGTDDLYVEGECLLSDADNKLYLDSIILGYYDSS